MLLCISKVFGSKEFESDVFEHDACISEDGWKKMSGF